MQHWRLDIVATAPRNEIVKAGIFLSLLPETDMRAIVCIPASACLPMLKSIARPSPVLRVRNFDERRNLWEINATSSTNDNFLEKWPILERIMWEGGDVTLF